MHLVLLQERQNGAEFLCNEECKLLEDKPQEWIMLFAGVLASGLTQCRCSPIMLKMNAHLVTHISYYENKVFFTSYIVLLIWELNRCSIQFNVITGLWI